MTNRLSDALALLMKPDDQKSTINMLTVEAMMERLGQMGRVSLIRTRDGGWYAYMEIQQGPASLKIESQYGVTTCYTATHDLYHKAAKVLRFVP